MTNDLILHVDGDNFFVSCEMTRFPEFKGKPAVVGKERGIACAVNAEAKKLGISRTTPIFQIKRDHPEVIILTSHFDLYHTYSKRLARILRRYTEYVEEYSIDECFALLKVKDMEKYGSWEGYISHIKSVVQEELGITFSFGLAETKVLAKVASSIKKPDGCTVLYAKDVDSVLTNTPIEKVWGVGRKLSKSLQIRGVTNAFLFTQMDRVLLERQYAKPVQELWHELSSTRIYTVHTHTDDPKSTQTTRSFRSIDNREFLISELSRNIEVVCARIQKQKLYTRSISFFLKYDMWKYAQMHIALDEPTMDTSLCIQKGTEAFSKLYVRGVKYRGTGVTLHGLVRSAFVQKDLFGYHSEPEHTVTNAINEIRNKFGKTSINFVSSMYAIDVRKKENDLDRLTDRYIHGLPLPYLGEVY